MYSYKRAVESIGKRFFSSLRAISPSAAPPLAIDLGTVADKNLLVPTLEGYLSRPRGERSEFFRQQYLDSVVKGCAMGIARAYLC